MQARVTRRRLTREDWLARALEVLGAEGLSRVCVEPLADSLGVTKGSFYWHFEDRDELLTSLLDYWEEEYTNGLEASMDTFAPDPESQLLGLLELIAQRNTNRFDAAIRAWALNDERAAAHLSRVDQKRLDYVRDLFREMGFSPEEADLRGRISYYYLVGENSVLAEPPSAAERLAYIRRRHRMLTTR